MYRVAILSLFVGLIYGNVLDTNVVYWACDKLNGSPCFGIVQYENGQASEIPLSTTGFDLLKGFAINSENGVGYLLVGDSSYNATLFNVVTAKLVSGDVVSYSSGNFTLGSKTEVVDVHFDAKSSQLIAFIKSPGSYDLYSIDIASGSMTLIINVYSSFTYAFFSSSVYNSPLFTAILVGPEGEMTSYLVDISSNKITTNVPPYSLGSLAVYDSASNLLVGSTFDFPTLANQFVFYQPSTGNYTFGNSFGVGDYCGASPHSAYDPNSQYYYTMCCQGAITGCLNATISTFQVTNGDNIAELDLAWEEQPAFGFYL